MFSGRTGFDLRPNDLSILTDELRRRGSRLLDLTLSNPTRAGIEYPSDRILAAISHPAAMVYEPDPSGLLRAREAIAQFYLERGAPVDPDDIILTASTSEAYSFLFKLLTDPGDAILIPSPGYPLFQFLAKFEGVHSISYPLIYTDEWVCDIDELSALAEGSQARAFLCVHPNNPTGSYFKEMARLQDVSRSIGVPIVCDEVFFDYALTPGPTPDPAQPGKSLTFVLNGLSKTLALPQMKLSWILIQGPDELKSPARERLDLIGDTYLSVNTAVQHAIPELLNLRRPIQDQIRARLLANLGTLRTECRDTGLRLLEPEGGWYALLRLPAWHRDEDFALAVLRERGVLVHPGSFFGFSGTSFLVVSLLPQPPDFSDGVRALVELAT